MDERRLRVLVVDDEPEICRLVVLNLAVHEVTTADCYEAADDLLSEQAWDVVILDVMGVNGLQLLAQYGGRFPCIIFTAHDLALRANEGGARRFLKKDEVHRLCDCVEEVSRASIRIDVGQA